MPQYRSPGVYVEEIDAGPKPIEGVSTSICGAVGVTAMGPSSGKPVLVTSFAEYTRTFGGLLPDPEPTLVAKWKDNKDDGGYWWQFPLAVKAFFDNGGQQLYVKRVFSGGARASKGNFGKGLVSEIVSEVPKGAASLKLQHLVGIRLNSQVQLFNGATGTMIVQATVDAMDSDRNTITLHAALSEPLSARRRDFVQIQQLDTGKVADGNAIIQISAREKGAQGNELYVRVRPMIGGSYNILVDPAIPNNTPATTSVIRSTVAEATLGTPAIPAVPAVPAVPATGGNPAIPAIPAVPAVPAIAPTLRTVTATVDSVVGFSSGEHVTINGNKYKIDAKDDGLKTFTFVDPTLVVAPGDRISRRRPAHPAGAGANSKVIYVWNASSLYKGALVQLSNDLDQEINNIDTIDGNRVTLVKDIVNAYLEGDKVRVVEAELTVQDRRGQNLVSEEIFSNLRLNDDDTQPANYLPRAVANNSKFVQIDGSRLANTDLTKFPAAPIAGLTGLWKNLDDVEGDDALGQLSTQDFVGIDEGSGNRTGIQAFEDITDVSIIIAPGIWSSVVQSALITHCELLKSRFAILDPRNGLSMEEIQEFRAPIDTKYAALYYPWVVVRDPSANRDVIMAPSGHMAGIYARVDIERGVFKAPANEVIANIRRLEQDINKREQDILNPLNINVLRYFPQRGNRVWGARVLTSDESWKYVPVRRLFIYVEQSIDRGTQFVVFEPNDEPLWARVRQTITNFLTTVWRSGALQGGKPAEAFFVKCDRTTMSQDDIDNGRLICLIGIAPVKPAEFVIFRIQQKTLDQVTA